MKKRNNSKATNNWLATAVAAALTLCCTTVSAQPTTHADAAFSKTAHEVVDWEHPKHFTNSVGGVFEFYDVYLLEEGQNLTYSMLGREPSCGIIWQATDYSQVSSYILEYDTMFTWDTEGTFSFNGEEYEYNLVPAAELTRAHREMIEKTIVGILPDTPEKLSYFDYSKDGRLLVNDLVLLNKRLANTPFTSVTNCDPAMYDQMSSEKFFEILDYWYANGETCMQINYGDSLPVDSVSEEDVANE